MNFSHIIEKKCVEMGWTVVSMWNGGALKIWRDGREAGVIWTECGKWDGSPHQREVMEIIDTELDHHAPRRIPNQTQVVRKVRTNLHLFVVRDLWPADEDSPRARYELHCSTLNRGRGGVLFIDQATLEREFPDKVERIWKNP